MQPLFFWFSLDMIKIPHSEQFDDIYFTSKAIFVVAEMGFGAGLNFLHAWAEFEKKAEPHQKLHYYAFEQYPLSPAEIGKNLAHRSHEFGGRLERLIAQYPMRVGGWHTIRLSAQVTLTLIFDDINRAIPELDTPVDFWILVKNVELSDILSHHVERLRAKSIIVPSPTYQKIAVIGGGIAGAAVASALLREGCEVTLFEKNGIASGASGNVRGLCNPRITALREIEADFYGPAFSRANKLYQDISKHTDIGYVTCGSMHLITDDRKDKRYRLFPDNWAWHSDHARVLSPVEASRIAGVDIAQSVLFLPEAAAVCPRAVTAYLAKDVPVVQTNVLDIQQVDAGWVVDGRVFDTVILAGGHEVNRFSQAAHIPLQKVRGQITEVQATPEYNKLKTNLCYSGYASVAENGKAVIGSTFQYWIDDAVVSDADDVENLEKLGEYLPQLAEGLQVIGSRAAFRCAAKDRLPVIGEVAGYKGLYMSTGHASHGLLSAIMAAEMLVVKICGLCQILPRSVDRLLSSGRLEK